MEKFTLLEDTPTDASDSIRYVHIVEQTYEEKVAMYKKCTKKELISMLLECHRLLGI